MKTLDLQSVVYKDGEYFVAQCLDVDVSSFGDTEQKALENLREALTLYFEDEPADAASHMMSSKLARVFSHH